MVTLEAMVAVQTLTEVAPVVMETQVLVMVVILTVVAEALATEVAEAVIE